MKVTEHEYQSLPADLQQAILERCESFAESWRTESISEISSILARPLPATKVAGDTLLETSVPQESVLLYELLRIDVQKRVVFGTTPEQEIYVTQFPNETEIIESVFSELNAGTLTTLGPDRKSVV